MRWNHQVDPKASLTDRFSASVNLGTSQNFTNNFNSSTVDYLSNTFQSNIAWTHLWPASRTASAVNLRHSQNTLNRTFDITLPGSPSTCSASCPSNCCGLKALRRASTIRSA
jgi:hypothetical protein